MLSIPDDLLMDSYKKAVALNLCPQFITILEKRSSDVPSIPRTKE